MERRAASEKSGDRRNRATYASHIPLLFSTLLLLAGAPIASAENLEFGWSGTVTSVDPAFAAVLPSGSGVAVGARAFVRFEFESTTLDQDPSPSVGDYLGAITRFDLQIGDVFFRQKLNAGVNTIIVFSDPLFGFYEPRTPVAPTEPLSGFEDLVGDVLFVPTSPAQILDDSLFLSPPDPQLWSSAASGILDGAGGVLVNIQLDTICTGACQPPLPTPVVPLFRPPACLLLLGLMLVSGHSLLSRSDRMVSQRA